MPARSGSRQRRQRRLAELHRNLAAAPLEMDMPAAESAGPPMSGQRRLRRRDVLLGASAGVAGGGLLAGLNWFDAQSRRTVADPIAIEPLEIATPAATAVPGPDLTSEPESTEKPFIAQSPEELDGHRNATLSHRLGDPGAPLLLVEYFSYTCSHCISFAALIEPQVVETYVDTGQALLVARHRPFDTDAISASRVAIAAAAQDPAAFWPMHHLLLNRIRDMAANGYSWEEFEPIGAELGLDGKLLVEDAQSDATSEILQANISEASRLEVNATPTFFLNGERMVGSGSLNEFLAAIEKTLGNA